MDENVSTTDSVVLDENKEPQNDGSVVVEEESPKETGTYTPPRDERGRVLPGYTLNPNGRPKDSISVVAAIKRKLKEVDGESKKTYLEKLVQKVIDKLLNEGDVAMIRDIIDRIDGKPTQKIAGDIENQAPINLLIYGDSDRIHNTLQLDTGGASDASVDEQGEVQDDSVAQESTQNDVGAERTD